MEAMRKALNSEAVQSVETKWYGSEYVRRDKWLPIFNSRRLGSKYVLTCRNGDWDVLSETQYGQLFRPFTPRALVERLALSGVVLFSDVKPRVLEQWMSFNDGIDEFGPRLHIIHLTQRCNLGCSYCHSSAIPVEATGRDMALKTAIQTADFIAKIPSKVLTINFQGGEPTLMPSLIRSIMSRLKDIAPAKRVRASLTTNGTLLTQDVLDVLRDYSVSTTVSLDGPKKVNDVIRVYRDGRGSYDDAVAGRRLLMSQKGAKFSGSILVLTSKTIGSLKETIDEYVRLGNESIHLKPVTKLGFGKSHWDDLGITFEEYWAAYVNSIEYMLSLQSSGIVIKELQMVFALQMLMNKKKPAFVDFRNPCGLVHGVLNYDIDGKIYACHEGKRRQEFRIGTVLDDPVELLLSDEANDIASASILDKHQECRSCAYLPFCSPCPANSHQSTGSMDIKPYEDFHCRFTLSLFDYLIGKLESDPEALMAWWRHDLLRAVARNGDPEAVSI
jgi:uncharacterized protein